MNERNEKYFAYISISELSHDNFNYAGYVDRPTHKLMTKLFEEDMIKDTVIFFFSDHGIRLGPVRGTHSGEIEARLPFMFIHLPTGYMNVYRDILHENQYRLTTAFDIHSTLTHIVNGMQYFILTYFLEKILNIFGSEIFQRKSFNYKYSIILRISSKKSLFRKIQLINSFQLFSNSYLF